MGKHLVSAKVAAQRLQQSRRSVTEELKSIMRERRYQRAGQKGKQSLAAGADSDVCGYLCVKDSSLQGAGKGVFAERVFRKNEYIIIGVGTLRTVGSEPVSGCAFEFQPGDHYGLCLDFYNTRKCNIVRFINTDRSGAPVRGGAGTVGNVVILELGPFVVVQALKTIKIGDELLANYRL